MIHVWSSIEDVPESAVVTGAAEDLLPPKRSFRRAAIVDVESLWGSRLAKTVKGKRPENPTGPAKLQLGVQCNVDDSRGNWSFPGSPLLKLQGLSQPARTGAVSFLYYVRGRCLANHMNAPAFLYSAPRFHYSSVGVDWNFSCLATTETYPICGFNMAHKVSARTYGKKARKPLAGMPLADLDVNMTPPAKSKSADKIVGDLTTKLQSISIQEKKRPIVAASSPRANVQPSTPEPQTPRSKKTSRKSISTPLKQLEEQQQLRVLTWEDVCQPGDRIEKIAEASYAEVYRITNDRGTSIIKVIRLASPIRPQTKAQQKSGLVDEEPHGEDDLAGELQISELLADIPGFVIYKEKYIVQGKTTPALLETHQTFHRRVKRKDPDRLQFYPSPSRYVQDTKFLVVELGDAGMALEDLDIISVEQIWDVFLGVAIALARAENLVQFEVRLGNLSQFDIH